MPEKLIHLHTSGSLPGIPGEHAPGLYWLDMEARTIRPIQPADTAAEEPQSDSDARPESSPRKRKQAKDIEE